MAKAKGSGKSAPISSKRRIEQYDHPDKKRANNPHVGLVTPSTDKDERKKKYAYDPHLDPQLVWAGKAEHTSFEVPTVSLHVHERIDPKTIISAVRKWNGENKAGHDQHGRVLFQGSLFDKPEENPPLREALDFYKHAHNWSNRLIAGDSLLVMNSLLQKEGMAGKVQMVYFDPPYGIKYGSNFQPFVNKRDVKDGKDEDLTQEPEMIRAFRDTWELGIHSYLTYLRDRLLLAREMLSESGSIFVQISDENIHHVRELMDEVFGLENFVSIIAYSTTGGFASSALSRAGDYIIWYARNKELMKFRPVYVEKPTAVHQLGEYDQLELSNGTRRPLSEAEKSGVEPLPEDARIFTDDNPTSQGTGSSTIEYVLDSKKFHPGESNHWKAPAPDGMNRLAWAKRFLVTPKGKLRYIRFLSDFGFKAVTNLWVDIAGAEQDRSDRKVYVVQTSKKILARCMLMCTDPGDLVFDPTCGSEQRHLSRRIGGGAGSPAIRRESRSRSLSSA